MLTLVAAMCAVTFGGLPEDQQTRDQRGGGSTTGAHIAQGPNAIFPNRFAYAGSDPKLIHEQRLSRMREILSAHPEAAERLRNMPNQSERIAFIRDLDRKTPHSQGRREARQWGLSSLHTTRDQ